METRTKEDLKVKKEIRDKTKNRKAHISMALLASSRRRWL